MILSEKHHYLPTTLIKHILVSSDSMTEDLTRMHPDTLNYYL